MTRARPLVNRRILVTRPVGQAQGLMALIEEQGGQAWHFPLLGIEPLTEPAAIEACKQRMLSLDLYQHVIFVSTNAVEFGMAWIEDYWPQVPVGIHWHGIGKSTCQAMQRAGLAVIQGEFSAQHPMNSEALLALPELQQLSGEKFLIIRGMGGREHLREQLSARGGQVDVAECYQRRAPSQSPRALLELIHQQHIGTICINSGDSLHNLCHLLADKLATVQALELIVPSQRVYNMAVEFGFKHVTLAANASDTQVLEALLQSSVIKG